MSGWDINIELTVNEVQDILATMPDTMLTVHPDHFALSLSEDGVAYGEDAAPDRGTDITVKAGALEEPAWQLYRFLESATDSSVVLWMMNDGALLEAARGTTAEELGL